MTKLLMALAALLLAAGCATPAKQELSGRAGLRMNAVATLATNSCETTTAPAYTAVIVLANRAAERVRLGAIGAEAATFVLNQGRAARADLDVACKGGQLNQAVFDRAQTSIRAMHGALQ